MVIIYGRSLHLKSHYRIFDRKEKTPVLVSRIVLAGGIFQIIIQYNCILFFDMSDDCDFN